MPMEALELTSKFMHTPAVIVVKRTALMLDFIQQFYVDVVTEASKLESICDLYGSLTVAQFIVYCNTRKQGP
jgi:superfamily II DNA/RNA helicase